MCFTAVAGTCNGCLDPKLIEGFEFLGFGKVDRLEPNALQDRRRVKIDKIFNDYF